MARNSPWAEKVLALARGGNLDAAIAQVKVAPSLKDLQALQAALIVHRLAGRWRNLDQAITDALADLSAPRLHRAP
tara:strand:- start:24 stop:251 length:228 start_codon:yes stop_codon:yes gene_type:complete